MSFGMELTGLHCSFLMRRLRYVSPPEWCLSVCFSVASSLNVVISAFGLSSFNPAQGWLDCACQWNQYLFCGQLVEVLL